MPTNVDGVYLGDPRFEPIWQALDARKAVVFIHPCASQIPPEMRMGLSDSTIEFMFESTRTVTSLAYGGVLRRYRDLRIITSHGGGTVPYIATRIATQSVTQNAGRIPQTTPEEVLDDLRRLYYDLTASMNPMALAAILELVPKSHLLCGFDCPARPQWLHDKDLRVFSSSPLLTDADREAIRRTNALKLFPRFANPGTGN
jgi:aminocarboxymuconate-semialdehyde decarboxylase